MTLAFLFAAVLATAELPEITLTPATGNRDQGAILLTGDNFYPCGVTSVEDPRWSLVRPLTSISAPIFPVLGNHDFCGKAVPEAQTQATGIIPRWRFPAPQYALRTPMADFAFISARVRHQPRSH